jgi:predicted MPP superfamily phosphohydrolase
MPLKKTLLLGAAAAAASCVAYGTFVEGVAFRLRRVDVPVLHVGETPLRILHISDVHLLARQKRKRAFLASLAGLEPDLVISTGDNLSSPDAVDALRDSLGRLLDLPGAFVFGSNDYHAPSLRNPLRYLWSSTARHDDSEGAIPVDALRAALSSGGWIDLNHHKAILDVSGHRLELRGTEDAHEHRDDYAAVAGTPANGVLALGVTHAPYRRILDAMASDGVRLVFAGHTHGGQVCVPCYGALTSNCDLPPSLAKGLFLHRAGDTSAWVHVSAGLGMSPFAPFRFACPPEATLLTLTPALSPETSPEPK